MSRGGWHTTRLTVSRQFRTSWITWSRGALSRKYLDTITENIWDGKNIVSCQQYLATSSPLMERIWSPGMSLSTLGPPPVTNLGQGTVLSSA